MSATSALGATLNVAICPPISDCHSIDRGRESQRSLFQI
jgi:hypothetical protein